MCEMFKINSKHTKRTSKKVVLVSLFLTTNRFHILFGLPIVDFEQRNASWADILSYKKSLKIIWKMKNKKLVLPGQKQRNNLL